MTALTALSPLDGRYQTKLEHVADYFSEFALIKARLTVELMWLVTLSETKAFTLLPAFTEDEENFIHSLVTEFSVDDAETIKAFEKTTNHDVKAVEYFIKEKLATHKTLTAYQESVHFGCTSEDINNLAYGCLLLSARENVLLPIAHHTIETLRELAHDNADAAMLARTHGQPASPTTLGKEWANVVYRLQLAANAIEETPIMGKCNGAVGNFNAHMVAFPQIDWETVSITFISELGLSPNPYTTQIEPHDALAELCDAMARFNTIVIDFARDTWGYISLGYLGQQHKDGEVGSSTMPHKINPIDFENAEGNAGIANALLKHFSEKLPISRFQRDLSDSTVLRNVGVAWGHSVLTLESLVKGLKKITVNREVMLEELDQHWEVLTEAVQTILRREQVEAPYEQLKTLSRGAHVTKENLHAFIDGLTVSDAVKKEMKALTPASYLGNAVEKAGI